MVTEFVIKMVTNIIFGDRNEGRAKWSQTRHYMPQTGFAGIVMRWKELEANQRRIIHVSTLLIALRFNSGQQVVIKTPARGSGGGAPPRPRHSPRVGLPTTPQ